MADEHPDGVRELPSGTVTFLFTDIEGSTRLLDELGDRYAEVLSDHRRALREAIAANAGVEVDTQGDAFFVAFPRASDAVEAAAQAQRALDAGPVRVRMGLHTGEPSLTDEGYVGMDVHRAARVMAAGHGGQVLLSQTTRELLDDGFELRDLGEHRLKDLSAPQRLFQLGPDEFPPLKTLHQTNLPFQPTPLVGRERELAEAGDLLRESRLVTLVGPGGSGKTRLGLQLAAEAVEDFEQGVYWVPLQAVTDPELVSPAIAQAVGARNGLAEALGNRIVLLLLDNLEQVLDAAAGLADLLRETTGVKLLVTSREPLRLAGEQRYPVEPLPEDDAITLFVERARSVDPAFVPGPAVAEICRRLDGLPLALELAAARVGLLAPEVLLGRLERALPLLTGGARDAPERQRTLQATIEWSYELLDEDEQRLFRRLAVFAGSFDLDAAQAVCDADLDTLQSLLDKSLLRRWASGRLGMLETIHEYARDRLTSEETEETEETGGRHAAHYLAVAQSGNFAADATGEVNPELGRLEEANFRAALAWAHAHRDIELGLRIAVALEAFWVFGRPFEGARWFEELFAGAAEVEPKLRADALRSFGGVIYIVGEFDRGVALYQQSLALYRSLGHAWGEAHMLHRLAVEASRTGESKRARELAQKSLDLARRLGYRREEAIAIGVLGMEEERDGNHDRAIELFRRSADEAGETGFIWWQGGSLLNLAEAAFRAGRQEEANGAVLEALPLIHRLGDRQHLVYGLALLAAVLAEQGRFERAGVIWGAVEAEEQRGRIGQWEDDREQFKELVLVHASPELERGCEEGRTLTLDEAVERALADD